MQGRECHEAAFWLAWAFPLLRHKKHEGGSRGSFSFTSLCLAHTELRTRTFFWRKAGWTSIGLSLASSPKVNTGDRTLRCPETNSDAGRTGDAFKDFWPMPTDRAVVAGPGAADTHSSWSVFLPSNYGRPREYTHHIHRQLQARR